MFKNRLHLHSRWTNNDKYWVDGLRDYNYDYNSNVKLWWYIIVYFLDIKVTVKMNEVVTKRQSIATSEARTTSITAYVILIPYKRYYIWLS